MDCPPPQTRTWRRRVLTDGAGVSHTSVPNMYTGRRARAYSRPHVNVVKHGNELATLPRPPRTPALPARRREDGGDARRAFRARYQRLGVHNTHSQSELSVQPSLVLAPVATTLKLSGRFCRTDPTEQPNGRCFAPGLHRANSRVYTREHSPAGKTRRAGISLHLHPAPSR